MGSDSFIHFPNNCENQQKNRDQYDCANKLESGFKSRWLTFPAQINSRFANLISQIDRIQQSGDSLELQEQFFEFVDFNDAA